MRLKKSPKETIRILDSLIQDGVKIMDWMRTKNWDHHKNPVVTSLEDYNHLQEMKKQSTELEQVEFFSDKIDEWSDVCLKELKNTFLDTAPIYRFRNASPGVVSQKEYYSQYVVLESNLQSKLNTLVEYYNELSCFIRSPLVYLPEKAQIWFYDFVVQLEPDSNEASLCHFLFNFGIGELKEFEDVYAYIKGENEEPDKWPKNWQTSIRNAYDGINKKANKNFGFNIVTKVKTQVGLHFPNRFINQMS